MKYLYVLHRWSSAVSATFFLLLCLTGLPLLFNSDVSRWNEPEQRPSFGALPYHDLWCGAAAGIQKIEEAMPGRAVQAISAYADRGVLLYHLTWQDENGRVCRDRIVYAPQSDTLAQWRSSYVKSSALAEFMGTMHNLHLRLSMGRGGMVFLTVMCFLSLVSIVGGVLLYPSFMRHRLFGGTRGGISAGNFFDWHNFLGIITAIWAALMSLSGVAIAAYIIGYDSYLDDIDALLPPSAAHSTSIDYEEMLSYAKEHFPTQDILYLAASHGGEPAVMSITDAPYPSMFRGQEVYLLRGVEGELMHYTMPLPRWFVVCDHLRELHLYNHNSLPLKIIWVILDLLTIAVVVTGGCGWGRRTRQRKEILPVLVPGINPMVRRVPPLFAMLSLIGMIVPLMEIRGGAELGTAAWMLLLAMSLFFWWKGKR